MSVFNDVSQYVLGKAILQTFHKKRETARNKQDKKKENPCQKVILCRNSLSIFFFRNPTMGTEKGLWRTSLPGIPTMAQPKKLEVLLSRSPKCFPDLLVVEIPMASFCTKLCRRLQQWPAVVKDKYIRLPWPHYPTTKLSRYRYLNQNLA